MPGIRAASSKSRLQAAVKQLSSRPARSACPAHEQRAFGAHGEEVVAQDLRGLIEELLGLGARFAEFLHRGASLQRPFLAHRPPASVSEQASVQQTRS